ncbi:VWA domain-containing protein [Hyunsoonleella flava]|uniref:VWA domain-containing protein n=1 Tax=Hyunsoonleella flava TaxID=2527939 RepID=A0A4Q9FLL9_9FLAO|nr:VWA domain-containing protein [Hyunsoonleella flava]TBN06560.1 VWA domain-containing protein [Hyunsoonleella flava]
MQTETVLYIILSGIIALLVALFQYKYKTKHRRTLSIAFSFLRFLSVFAMLLLLVNPKFDQIKVFTEKPNLIVAVDNSNSIKHLSQVENVNKTLESIKNNVELTKKFDIEYFRFNEDIENSTILDFESRGTDIDKALNQISDIYKNDIAPVVLISDGNQTFGNDYAVSNTYSQPVYPIILGDTITYTDLQVKQLNVNKYAFLKNRFPVEAILLYQGNVDVTSRLTVIANGKSVFNKTINFSKENNSEIIQFTLPANKVGVRSYTARLEPIQTEKNTINNSKKFAVEAIDQKTKIALVSDMIHPDIGALKKSIESNEQRSVSILNPYEILNQINDFQLIILYQPNNKFKRLYQNLEKESVNTFTIIGTKTALGFLNNTVEVFSQESTGQTEDFQPKVNLNFSPFLVEDISFETFPPLLGPFGASKFSVPYETLLEKTVLGIDKNEPLLATLEHNSRREAVLFGENIWRWRAQSFMNEKSFSDFDNFMGKLVQYLASNKRKSRLTVEYESFYTGSSNIILKAQIFDKNYEFDARQSLDLILENIVSKEKQVLPFVLKNNNYQVDLSGLNPSKYNFTVRSKGENISKSGSFEVLEYNIEQQFLNADVTKLQQLATNTNGKAYFSNAVDALISDLLSNESYKTIQKSNKNTIPLIDWKFLLGIILLSLSAEWFLRKYNGLI